MRTLITLTLVLFLASPAFSLAGEWQTSNIPKHIKDVKIKVYNYASTQKGRAHCGSSQCYRMNVIVNGKHIATWATSPGKRQRHIDPPSSHTPEYKGRSIHPKHIYNKNYTSWIHKYEMPYAMYIKNRRGRLSNYAIHGGPTDGTKRSHGCIRLRTKHARLLNKWVKQAFRNGGRARVWADDTI